MQNNHQIYQYFTEFNLALQGDDFALAEQILMLMDNHSPNHLLVLDCLVRLQMQTFHHDKAIENVERAMEYYPQYPYFYYYAALIYGQMEKWQRACDYIVRAMEMDDQNINFMTAGADILTQLGRYATAVDIYRNIIMVGHNQYQAVLKLCRCYYMLGRGYEARQNLQQLWDILLELPQKNPQLLSDIVLMIDNLDPQNPIATFNNQRVNELAEQYNDILSQFKVITIHAQKNWEEKIINHLPTGYFALTSQYYGDNQHYYYLPELHENIQNMIHIGLNCQLFITDNLDYAVLMAYHQRPVVFLGQITNAENMGNLGQFITPLTDKYINMIFDHVEP